MVEISSREVRSRDITSEHFLVGFDFAETDPNLGAAADKVSEVVSRFIDSTYVRDRLAELTGNNRLDQRFIRGLTGELVISLIDAAIGESWKTGGGGGGGDVTAGQLEAALNFRDVSINSGSLFRSTLAAQETSSRPLFMYITSPIDETIDGTRHQYSIGDWLYVEPLDTFVNLLLEFSDIVNNLVERDVINSGEVGDNTIGKVGIEPNGTGLYTTTVKRHPARLATWTDTEYTNSKFLGISASSFLYAGHKPGDWYASPITLLPYVLTQRTGYVEWVQTTWASVGITTFRGGASRPEEIAHAIQANGDLWIDTDDFKLFVVSNFVAGSTGEPSAPEKVHYATSEQLEQTNERVSDIVGLPEFPAEGSRDNKVPKFSGDILGWEEDAQGGGGGGGNARDFGTGAEDINPLAKGDATDRWPADRLPEDVAYDEDINNVVDDIQKSALHVSILWPDGTSQPISYMNRRTLSELFQYNNSDAAAVRNAKSPIGFQIEGYIKGFDGIANLRGVAINGTVARDNSALSAEERISDGHFNLVAHPSNADISNIIANTSEQIDFAVNTVIDSVNGAYDILIPFDTRLERELPEIVPYIHPEYMLDDIYRRVSELRVEEGAQIWETLNTGRSQIAGIPSTSAIGMAILSSRLDPTTLTPQAVSWGYNFTQAADASEGIVILARIPITAVDRQDQLDDRFRLEIVRQSSATVYTTVGAPIAIADDFYYMFVTSIEANPGSAITFNLQQLTNPYRTIYNDKLGPRALESIPNSGGDYTLPQATTDTLGGVKGITTDIINAGTSTGIFGWTIANITRLVQAIVPEWARSGNTDRFPSSKMGSGTANNTTFLRGDRTWQALDLEGANLIPDNPDRPIQPTDDNADKILVRGGRLYENVLHSATDPVVTYRDFATSDLTGGLTWAGAHQVNPSPVQNNVIYSIPGSKFERGGTFGGRVIWGPYYVNNWRGPSANKEEADESVQAVGDVVYYGGTVRVVTAFTAGTNRRRDWVPILSVPSDHSVNIDKLADALLASDQDLVNGTDDKLTDAAKVNKYVAAQTDLRTRYGTSSTPVAGDRFFFTDENQTGDPVRYVTHRDLFAWRSLSVPAPSNNVNTINIGFASEVFISFTYGGALYTTTIPRIGIPSTPTKMWVDSRNPGASNNITSSPDVQSMGMLISLDVRGNMTINTTGWANQGLTPAVAVR